MAQKKSGPLDQNVVLTNINSMNTHITLDDIAQYYKIEEDFDLVFMKYNFIVAHEYFVGDTFLELGCATGESTLSLLKFASTIDVVEGSKINIDVTKKKLDLLPKHNTIVNFYKNFWEEFDYKDDYYTDILLFCGLEHLDNPGLVLKRLYGALKPGGRLHIVVPNAHSLHRKIGVSMGLLKEIHELNERDKMMGHKQVFDISTLIEIVRSNKFNVLDWRRVMLKVLSNIQMQKLYRDNPSLIQAFFEVGRDIPDKCAELYLCAERQL